jgi:ABC-type transporter Mla maintaining outer membrane lipid asymmetry permease subunit MlaE
MRRAAKAFVGWLLGASLVVGSTLALQTGYALGAFGAEARISGLLAVSVLRSSAAGVAASAASVALVVATHPEPRKAVGPLWQIYVLVPLAMPLAAAVMMTVGVGVAALGFGVGPGASWQSVREIATLGDALYGLVLACAYAVVLGAIAAAAVPRAPTLRWGLVAKIAAALLVNGLVTAVTGAALGALATAAGPW